MTALAVLLGGAAGAAARYLLDSWVKSLTGGRLPWATLGINVLGSFVLGVVAAAQAHGHLGGTGYALLGVGLCGGFTTFSTFSVEIVELTQRRAGRSAIGYLVASLVLGLLAATAGWAVSP